MWFFFPRPEQVRVEERSNRAPRKAAKSCAPRQCSLISLGTREPMCFARCVPTRIPNWQAWTQFPFSPRLLAVAARMVAPRRRPSRAGRSADRVGGARAPHQQFFTAAAASTDCDPPRSQWTRMPAGRTLATTRANLAFRRATLALGRARRLWSAWGLLGQLVVQYPRALRLRANHRHRPQLQPHQKAAARAPWRLARRSRTDRKGAARAAV